MAKAFCIFERCPFGRRNKVRWKYSIIDSCFLRSQAISAFVTHSRLSLSFHTQNYMEAESSQQAASITQSPSSSTLAAKPNSHTRSKSWLLWWNTEEWWSCWIGLIFFGCVTAAVNHHIPQPEFLTWSHNPFMTFASPGNYGLLVIFVAMGLLLWLCMASIRANGWRRYPLGYLVVFLVALVSKMLASNGNRK